MRAVYAYRFNGTIQDLTVEVNEGAGFVKMGIGELRQQREQHPEKFTPFIASEAGTRLLTYIENH